MGAFYKSYTRKTKLILRFISFYIALITQLCEESVNEYSLCNKRALNFFEQSAILMIIEFESDLDGILLSRRLLTIEDCATNESVS